MLKKFTFLILTVLAVALQTCHGEVNCYVCGSLDSLKPEAKQAFNRLPTFNGTVPSLSCLAPKENWIFLPCDETCIDMKVGEISWRGCGFEEDCKAIRETGDLFGMKVHRCTICNTNLCNTAVKHAAPLLLVALPALISSYFTKW